MINDIAASDAPSLDEYLKALWRRKHFVVILTALGVVLASVYAGSLTRSYSANTQIIVGKLPTDNEFVPVSLEAERATLSGNDNIDRALATAGTNLTRAEVQQNLDATFAQDSNVMEVKVSALDADSAQKIANAIALAYADNRAKIQQTYYDSQISSLNSQIATLDKQIKELTTAISNLTNSRTTIVRIFPQTAGGTEQGTTNHEFGHNLGTLHASTEDFGDRPLGPPGVAGRVIEYGDLFDIMGGSGVAQRSAQHKSIDLQWLEPGEFHEIRKKAHCFFAFRVVFRAARHADSSGRGNG